MKRKINVQLTLLILTAMTFASSCEPAANKSRALDYPFAHHVFFWLHEPDNAQVRAQFEKAVEELLTIPEIKAYHVGTPAPVEERPVIDGSYTYSYLVFFEDIKGHDIYQVHPLHLKFIEENKHLWSKVQVYDSDAK
jgi:hypothetical protein